MCDTKCWHGYQAQIPHWMQRPLGNTSTCQGNERGHSCKLCTRHANLQRDCECMGDAPVRAHNGVAHVVLHVVVGAACPQQQLRRSRCW